VNFDFYTDPYLGPVRCFVTPI